MCYLRGFGRSRCCCCCSLSHCGCCSSCCLWYTSYWFHTVGKIASTNSTSASAQIVYVRTISAEGSPPPACSNFLTSWPWNPKHAFTCLMCLYMQVCMLQHCIPYIQLVKDFNVVSVSQMEMRFLICRLCSSPWHIKLYYMLDSQTSKQK